MTAPVITGATAISLTEGDAAFAVDQGLSFAGGSDFAGGFIRFAVSDANSGDQFTLTSGADANVSGAISVDAGGVVYLGNGSGREAIGAIDSVENGQDGAALKINLGVSTGAITNSGFETGTDGWTIVTDRLILNPPDPADTAIIGGRPAPIDPTIPPSAGDDAGAVTSMTYLYERSTNQYTEGGASLRLYNQGGTASGFDVVHGPYAVSDVFQANAGEIFRFDWRASAGGDAYDAFGYLLNVDTGDVLPLLDQTGADDSGETPWTSEAILMPQTGNWSFVFVAGTYDFTGGQAVGGSLYIDNIRALAPSPVDDAILKTISSQVTFQNTSKEAVGARSLEVAVSDGLGDQQSASADLEIANIPDAPTGGLQVSGAFKVGETLTVTDTIDDPDGIDASGVTYQWQRGSGGSWSDIADADGSTYEITSADQGYSIRLVAKFTDNGGTEETVTSNAISKPAPPSPPPVLDQHDNVSVGTIGADTLSGLEGTDTLQGGSGGDFLNGNQDNDILQGNQGADTLHGGQGDDIVRGGQDNDVVLGDVGDDMVFGDLGRDVVNGGEGNDILWGGQGANPDTADSGDTLSGEAGNDFVNGNGGDDAIDGGIGEDTVHGGRGDDVIFGGDGDDMVFGDLGNDTLSGGAGADQFQMHGGGRDVIIDFNLAQGDRVVLDAGASYTLSQQGADTVIDWSEGQVVLSNVQASSLTGDWIFA